MSNSTNQELNQIIITNDKDNKIKTQFKEILLNLLTFAFFLFSLVFLTFSIINKNGSSVNSGKVSASYFNGKIISYKFKTLDEIPFLIKKIDQLNVPSEQYLSSLKKNNQINEQNLIKEINEKIISFYTLKKFLKRRDEFPSDYQELLNEINQMTSDYQEKEMRFSGYYVKIRFLGYYGQREKEIKEKFGDQNLEKLAEEKIKEVINSNQPPETLFSQLNNDSIISELNNQEKSIDYFENNSFSIPLFDDPDFYDYLIEAPINQYSNIYTLKTKRPNDYQYEKYAFLVFFIEKKEGENLPLNYLIKKTINAGNYR